MLLFVLIQAATHAFDFIPPNSGAPPLLSCFCLVQGISFEEEPVAPLPILWDLSPCKRPSGESSRSLWGNQQLITILAIQGARWAIPAPGLAAEAFFGDSPWFSVVLSPFLLLPLSTQVLLFNTHCVSLTSSQHLLLDNLAIILPVLPRLPPSVILLPGSLDVPASP